MENYMKGKVLELDDDITSVPFTNLPGNLIHVKVKHGSKIRNLLDFAFRMFRDPEKRYIMFTGFGPGVVKTISCAEIVKRRYKSLHQITKLGYRRVEEYWEPKIPELDQLKVVREMPAIYILLCKDALDANEPGYQPPGLVVPFSKRSSSGRGPRRKFTKSHRSGEPLQEGASNSSQNRTGETITADSQSAGDRE